MAWGVFNKIGRGIKKGVDFVANKVIPVARKVIDIAKPLFKDTKFGEIIEKSDEILSYGEDIKKKYGSMDGGVKKKINDGMMIARGKNMYSNNKLMKAEFSEDDNEDDFE